MPVIILEINERLTLNLLMRKLIYSFDLTLPSCDSLLFRLFLHLLINCNFKVKLHMIENLTIRKPVLSYSRSSPIVYLQSINAEKSY